VVDAGMAHDKPLIIIADEYAQKALEKLFALPFSASWLVGACEEEMDPLPSPRKISNSSEFFSSNLDFSDHKGDMHFSDRKGDMHFSDSGFLLHTISL
jgi:hypothetical protein